MPHAHITTFLPQLDEAVAEIFLLMLGMPCYPSSHKPPEPTPVSPGLAATVVFSGTLHGLCLLTVTEECARTLTLSLIGPSATPDLHADTAGELCNMIAGSWKSRLAPLLANCTLSPPCVLAIPPAPALAPCTHTLNRVYTFAESSLALTLALHES